MIQLNGHLWEWYWSGDTYFSHFNNLHSANGITNHFGTEGDDALFYPYGQHWKSGENFADLPYYDGTTGEVFAMFRVMSPNYGRWQSPDPVAGDPSNPQSWNRYAYVLNNPTSLTNPLGLDDDDNCTWDPTTSTLTCPPPNSSEGQGEPPVPPGGDGGGGSGTGQVNKSYPLKPQPVNCNTNAVGLMQQVESNFSQFGNYTGNFGPLGIPTATGVVTFGNGPVTQGAVIPISNVNFVPNPLKRPGGFTPVAFNVSVTAASVSPSSFTFATNPGHVLYPATITFSASDVAPGQINFSIQVNGSFASSFDELLYYLGGNNLENNIWSNFVGNVQTACGGSTGPG